MPACPTQEPTLDNTDNNTVVAAGLNRATRRRLMRQGKTPAEIAAMSFHDIAKQHQDQADAARFLGHKTLQNLYNNTSWTEAELVQMRLSTYSAFDNLVKGNGTMTDFDGVGMAINVASVRAIEIDTTGLLTSRLSPAMDGFTRMQERHQRTGTLAFDGLGLQAARDALDIYDQILGVSTPRQMMTAVKVAMRVINDIKQAKQKENGKK
jgi:hypothetical protein